MLLWQCVGGDEWAESHDGQLRLFCLFMDLRRLRKLNHVEV